MSGSLAVSDLGKSYRRYGQRWHRLCEWVSAGRVAWRPGFLGLSAESPLRSPPAESGGVLGSNGAGTTAPLGIADRDDPADRGHTWRSRAAWRRSAGAQASASTRVPAAGGMRSMAGRLVGIPVQDLRRSDAGHRSLRRDRPVHRPARSDLLERDGGACSPSRSRPRFAPRIGGTR